MPDEIPLSIYRLREKLKESVRYLVVTADDLEDRMLRAWRIVGEADIANLPNEPQERIRIIEKKLTRFGELPDGVKKLTPNEQRDILEAIVRLLFDSYSRLSLRWVR